MSKIALSGNASGTGTFTIASPNSNSDRTLNLPDNSGTLITTASEGAVGTTNIADAAVTQAKLATAVIPIGVGQTWQDVTASRALGTTYTNTTGRPIFFMVQVTQNTAGVGINGFVSVHSFNGHQDNGNSSTGSYVGLVPNGDTYGNISVETGKSIGKWVELR